MSELAKKLRDWVHKGAVNDAALATLRFRQSRQAKRAHRNHVAQKKAERQAAQAAQKHHPALADSLRQKALRCEHRAIASHLRAQSLIARIKVRTRRGDDIQAAITHLKGDIARWEATHGPHVVSNSPDKAAGGTDRQRVVWCAVRALGSGYFYSQSGATSFNWCWSRIPSGYRSDCSQWGISVYHAAQLASPDGSYTDGLNYTGSIAAHCQRISRAQLRPGDFVLYGAYPYHHVEIYVGPGDLTIGHGSPDIDHGSIYMLGSAVAFYRAPELS